MFTITQTKVAMKVAGFKTEVDTKDFPEATVNEIWKYGTRRFFQDFAARKASDIKAAGGIPNGEEMVAERLEMCMTGEFSGGSLTWEQQAEQTLLEQGLKALSKTRTFDGTKKEKLAAVRAELIARKTEEAYLAIVATEAERLREAAEALDGLFSD